MKVTALLRTLISHLPRLPLGQNHVVSCPHRVTLPIPQFSSKVFDLRDRVDTSIMYIMREVPNGFEGGFVG